MAADGSIVIAAKMNIGKAEKDLAKLKGKIEKTENEIASITKKRDDASKKGAFGAEQLEIEKKLLSELEQKVEELKAKAADTNLSGIDRARARGALNVYTPWLEEQRKTVNSLKDEWDKTNESIKNYNDKIADANNILNQQKEEAGTLGAQIEAAKQAQTGFGAATNAAGKLTESLGKRIFSLAASAFVFQILSKAVAAFKSYLTSVINTNNEARAAMARLKGALLTLAQPLVQVIIPAFTAFVNLLAAIVSRIAQFISLIFGGTLKNSAKEAQNLYKANKNIGGSSGSAAKNLGKQADAMNDLQEAAEEATGSLASFDEINTIATEQPDAMDDMADALGGGGGSGGGLGDISPDFGFLDGIADRLQEIADYVALIAAGLALWSIGNKISGPLGDLLRVFGGLLITIGGIALAWDGLSDAWQNGVNWGNLTESIAGVAAAAFGVYQVFSVIAPAFANIAAGITLVIGGIAMLVTGFRDAFNSGWNLQNMLMAIAGIMATGLGISLIAGPGGWIAILVAAIASVLLAITVLTGHGQELLDGLKMAWQGLVDFIKGIATLDIPLIVQGIGEIFDGMGQVINAVLNGVKDAFLAFYNWLDEKTGGRLKQIVGAIQSVFESLSNYFWNMFLPKWDSFWASVRNGFKSAWNGVISILEGAVNLIIKGINFITSGISSALSFDLPGFMGGGHVGLSLPQIGMLSIPRLAQGAVIPANREFLAVLGDQSSGTNVEAPLKTIEQAMENVLGRSNYGGDIHITLELDGKVVTRTVVKNINQMAKSSTKPVLAL